MMVLRSFSNLVLLQPVFVVSSTILIFAAVLALAVPFLGLPSPDAMTAGALQPPSAEHLFGTDNFGRDILSRLFWGTRVALVVALGSAVIATLIGIVAGAISGFYGGVFDTVISRSLDVFLLIPTFFLVLLLATLFGSSLTLTMLAIAITTWPRSARIMRSQVLTLRSRVFVEASLASGATRWQALWRHVVPNALPPLITDSTLLMGLAILTEAGLSFLGLGDQNLVSWGSMIYDGQAYLRIAPWMSIFPGVAMLLLVAALNLVGDTANIALNPQLRRKGGQRLKLRRVPEKNGPKPNPDPSEILRVEGMTLSYSVGDVSLRAVDDVSFSLRSGESLGFVGESGSGKSTLGAALLQLLPSNARIDAGDVRFRGQEVLRGGASVTRGNQPLFEKLRWSAVSIIFQSSMNALNPVVTVRRQLTAALRFHRPELSKSDVDKRILELFEVVGIPKERLNSYPFQLSGGMRQRVMIVLALLLQPELIIADEPTTALDVLIQSQILQEINRLRKELGLSLIMISHDMEAVAMTCERIAVMYAGQIVEIADAETILRKPSHPYTRILLGAMPQLRGPKRPLLALTGEPSVIGEGFVGCRFATRCPNATDRCRAEDPVSVDLAPGHSARCFYAADFVTKPAMEVVA